MTAAPQVAQIGRGIVKYLQNKTKSSYLPPIELISAICLAHDIGHPPFGHGGEVALNYCMREHGGFEGNGQTLRIVSKLNKYTKHHGLNPTRRFLLGVLKYPSSYKMLENKTIEPDQVKTNSWIFKAEDFIPPKCYYDIDQDVVDFIFKVFNDRDRSNFCAVVNTGSGHGMAKYKSLDCSIMNLADNISYSIHDLEDAISLKLITKDDWNNHFEGNHQLFSNTSLDFCKIQNDLFSESFIRKNTIGLLVNTLITNTKIIDNKSGCTDGQLNLNAVLDDHYESLRSHIFKLVKNKMIKNTNVQQLEFKGQKIIYDIFSAVASDPNRLLPESTRKIWSNKPGNVAVSDKSYKNRVISDYISGMTDNYAIRLYERLYSVKQGSVFDTL